MRLVNVMEIPENFSISTKLRIVPATEEVVRNRDYNAKTFRILMNSELVLILNPHPALNETQLAFRLT